MHSTHAGAREDACGGRAARPACRPLVDVEGDESACWPSGPARAAVIAARAAARAERAAMRPEGRLQRGRREQRRRRLRRESGVVCAIRGHESAGRQMHAARAWAVARGRASRAASARVRGSGPGLARARPTLQVRMVDGLLEDCARAKRLAQRLRRRRALQAPAHGLCARRADAQTSAKSAGAGLRRAAAHRRAQAPTDARRERRQRSNSWTWSF